MNEWMHEWMNTRTNELMKWMNELININKYIYEGCTGRRWWDDSLQCPSDTGFGNRGPISKAKHATSRSPNLPTMLTLRMDEGGGAFSWDTHLVSLTLEYQSAWLTHKLWHERQAALTTKLEPCQRSRGTSTRCDVCRSVSFRFTSAYIIRKSLT